MIRAAAGTADHIAADASQFARGRYADLTVRERAATNSAVCCQLFYSRAVPGLRREAG